jgi:hypothetical protein
MGTTIFIIISTLPHVDGHHATTNYIVMTGVLGYPHFYLKQ